MTEDDGSESRDVNKPKRGRKLIVFTGAAGLIGLAVSVAIFAFQSQKQKSKKNVLPGSNVRINLSASEILKLADQIIAKSKDVYDAIASVPLDKVSYDNVVLPLAELKAHQFPLIQSCLFPKLVSTKDNVRSASAEAEQRIDAHFLACRKREDVYRVIKVYAAKGETKVPEAISYVQCLVRDYEHNGLNLTVTKRQEVQRLRNEIDDLSLQYVQNLKEDSTFLLFRETDLAGLPPEFLETLEKTGDGNYKVTLESQHVAAILELCKIGKTRRLIATAHGKRCSEINLSVLRSLVQTRHKLARLLGYANFADYAIGNRMAKTSSKVFEFLGDISSSLTDLAIRELEILKDLKRKEEGEFPFGIEDLLYYIKKVEEQQFDLDFGDIRQHFPVSLVLSGIFKISQDLFGLRIEEIANPYIWHQDVRAFSVFDFSSGRLLGYFYLDMYTREGKFSHTCVVSLQNSAALSNGARQIPVALLISQLQKDDGDQPGLLRFSEVVNLFHEFGHVVQHICNHASFARFSGLRVDPDFVEIPSQVLENWCYESFTLKLISGYRQDITKPLVDEVCKSLKRWRYSFSAIKLLQEILYCLVDQIIHSSENTDFLELFRNLHPKVMLGLPMLEGTNPVSCFLRTAIGSEATCYSRIWSEVFAADICASKFHDGLLNQYVGMQFRNKVLAPGGSKDPTELWHQKVYDSDSEVVQSSARFAMDWGVLNEAAAVDRYKSITGREVSSLSFAIHSKEQYHWLGASPDGLLDSFGILEVKCPYNKGKTETAMPWKTMPFYYMPQIQGQMEIMDRDWVDLYCWTPNGSTIFHVKRERGYWDLIYRILREFWWENVVPAREALLSGNVKEASLYKPTSTHRQTGLAIAKSIQLAGEAKLLCRETAGNVEFYK